MAEQGAVEHDRALPADGSQGLYQYENSQDLGLVDGIRFLYQRRLRLAVRFIALFGIGVIGFLYLRFKTPTLVEGTVALGFQGIERNEYPSGRKFSVEDFRGPDLLAGALSDAGIPKETMDVRGLSSQLYVIPAIPGDIQARWKKQEKDGTKKDEYFPNEFNLRILAAGLSNDQRIRLFDAIFLKFQQSVKSEQKSSVSIIAEPNLSYDKLAKDYDFWDIPALFRNSYQSLDEQINMLVNGMVQSADVKSQSQDTSRALSGQTNTPMPGEPKTQNVKYQLAFRNLGNELHTWEVTRLQALDALTYQGQLVKNRDVMIQRVQYQISDVDIQIKEKAQEAGDAERLLAILDQPKALLASQLNNARNTPMVDLSVVDKLIKSDYIGPLVERVSKLQRERQVLEAEKSRLQKQLDWLPKARNADLNQLPSGYRELIQTTSSELDAIVRNYDRLLDEYMTATITNLVTLRQPPIITRDVSSPTYVLAGIAAVAFFLAIVLMSLEHLFKVAKGQAARLMRQNAAG